MFFKRELSNLLKNLTDPLDPIERKLKWILKTAVPVKKIINALAKVNRHLNDKPPHLEEIISYLEHSINIINQSNEIKHQSSINNKQLYYYALNHILNTIQKHNQRDNNYDQDTLDKLKQKLLPMKLCYHKGLKEHNIANKV